MIRVCGSYIAAVVSTYVIGAVFISQGNIASVVAMGFEVTFAHRLDAAIHDVTNMTGIYLPTIAVGFVIALPVAALIIRFVPNLRLVGYVLAGFVALIAIHVIVKMVFGISGIAPTRTLMGLMAQGVAGAAGGLLFHVLTVKKAAGTHLD